MAGGMLLMPPTTTPEEKILVIVRRRSILLTICAATSPNVESIQKIIQNGFLTNVKGWLDDCIQNSVGDIDFILHMLESIVKLPVTRSSVADSKLGRAVVAITNSKIFKDLDSSDARVEIIQSKINSIKKEWRAAVQREQERSPTPSSQNGTTKDTTNTASSKRSRDTQQIISDNTISSRTTDAQQPKKKKIGSISDLIRKSAPSGTTSTETMSAAEVARMKAKERLAKSQAVLNPSKVESSVNTKKVTWPDQDSKEFPLENIHEVESEFDAPLRKRGTLKDHRKQDIVEEKERLEKAKKVDFQQKQDKLDAMGSTNPSLVEWKPPAELILTNPITQPVTSEIANQAARILTVSQAQYFTIDDIPHEPTPLSDVEETLQITSIATAPLPVNFPFFVSQKNPITASAPSTTFNAPEIHSATSTGSTATATPDFVRSLGLPSFLVGYDVQALQTLAGSPGLMASFVDAQGRIDQVRLLQMVNSLTVSSNKDKVLSQFIPVPPPTFTTPAHPVPPVVPGIFGLPQTQGATNFYQPTQQMTLPQSSGFPSMPVSKPRTYRGEQNGDGNLHISGYGPVTELDIIQLFSPYVKVDEVVMKGTFSFVNTGDPMGAQTAMQALQGAILGGRPIKVSPATRRAPDPSRKFLTGTGAFDGSSAQSAQMNVIPNVPLPQTAAGEIDLDNVYDDRGNMATKNLFVAGYGPGTTEQYLMSLFSPFGHILGVVMKSTFAFVNTTDRLIAVRAREALTGQNINGGSLRINFAKESGRLGTSFDATQRLAAGLQMQQNPAFSYYNQG